jgi:hypothetical protein
MRVHVLSWIQLIVARRTAECPVGIAWSAIESAKTPRDVASSRGLHAARALIAQKVEQHTHTPPKFSKDGRFALLTISCPDQIHPVIATRWYSDSNGCFNGVGLVISSRQNWRPSGSRILATFLDESTSQ